MAVSDYFYFSYASGKCWTVKSLHINISNKVKISVFDNENNWRNTVEKKEMLKNDCMGACILPWKANAKDTSTAKRH